MSNRFDNRSVNTFKKDIKFGTMLEKYFFHQWLEVATSTLMILSWEDNGCGNDGEFIASGNTAGADYKVNDVPLEIKWVPTAGKFTLKENDLKAYIREGADILFIYNTGKSKLRKPKDYDLPKHIELIEENETDIRWGIMQGSDVKRLYEYAKENNLFRPINYMGGKSAVVLKSKDFHKYFMEREWKTK
tara:strand:- start:802 stop:1368 length:567 start_codon:yes stop_codon:yes gene_type:complete